MTRAVEDLCDTVIKMTHKEGTRVSHTPIHNGLNVYWKWGHYELVKMARSHLQDLSGYLSNSWKGLVKGTFTLHILLLLVLLIV